MKFSTEFVVILVALCAAQVFSATTGRRTSRIRVEKKIESNPLHTLSLPSNATAIRSDITDQFSCANKAYGYYADVDNDCQIFHVCLPVTFADGRERMYRWSFICPEQTIFSQEAFTCVRSDEVAFDCASSERFYDLNRHIGAEPVKEVDSNDLGASSATGNRRNSDSNKIVQNTAATTPLISTTAVPRRTSTVVLTTTPTISTTRPTPTASTFVSTTRRFRRPTATAALPIASVPKETNTLLESALRKSGLVKVTKKPILETTTVDLPTTTVTDEAITTEPVAFTTDLPETTTDVPATETQTTIVQTTPEFLYTRIVPELLENNSNIVVQPVEPLFNPLFNVQSNDQADALIRNIKQLQSNMLLSASTAAATSDDKPVAAPRVQLPRRFLFSADVTKNRLKQ